jgi:hypothetical protein
MMIIGAAFLSLTLFFSECLLNKTIQLRIQLFWNVCARSPSRFRARCVESDFYAPSAYSLCCWGELYSKSQLAVRYLFNSQNLNYLTHFRYRHVPTFGNGTIRKFHTNASAMKKLAARDFEDLLQVRKYPFLSDFIDDDPPSAQFLSSRIYCPNLITTLFWIFFSFCPCGMHMQSSDYTHHQPSRH